MMDEAKLQQWRRTAIDALQSAGIVLTKEESENIEVAELGLNDFERTGLCLVIYENNDRYCAKELVLLPRQTCPQHKHPAIGELPGKRETFRCRAGDVYLFVEGTPKDNLSVRPPLGDEKYYTVYNEIHLKPGDQYTIPEDTYHWFQAGVNGAVVSEFSTTSRDEFDEFIDPRIQRVPKA